jgi:hypothetical protein
LTLTPPPSGLLAADGEVQAVGTGVETANDVPLLQLDPLLSSLIAPEPSRIT